MALKFLNDGYFAGKVGIGTESPDGNLEIVTSAIVSGASDTVNNVLIGLQAANRPTIILDTADTTYTNRTWNITNVGSAGKLFIGRNGLDVMVMDNSGKVGIGTESPSRNLQVKGTANTAIAITSSTSSLAQLALGDTDDDNYAQIILDNSTNKLQIQNGGGGIISNRGITLDSSENVGIGTDDPIELLHLYGGVGNPTRIRLQADDGQDDVLTFHQSTTQKGAVGYDDSDDVVSLTYGGLSGTTGIKINSSGNVGIGTTNPLYKLHITDSTASGRAVQGIQSATSGTNYGAVFTAEGSGATKNVGLYADAQGATTNYAAIFDNGNVGIGTNNPVVKLQVNGGIRAVGATSNTGQIDASPDFGAFRFYNGSIFRGGLGMGQWASVGNSTDIVQYLNNVNYYISNGTTALLKVEPTGNVGIGTTSPDLKLDVTHATAGEYVATFQNTGSNLELKLGVTSTGYLNIQGQQINNSATFNMSLQADGGNVGINTTIPTQKLHVVGNARVTGAYYDSNNSPGTANQVLVSTATGTDWIDGSGSSIIGGPYLPLAGNTTATAMTGDIILENTQQVRFLTSGNLVGLRLQSSGTSSFIDNEVGDMYIRQEADGNNIFFQADDGSGGNATYFSVRPNNGARTQFEKNTRHNDGIKAFFGTDEDLRIYHDGTNSHIDQNVSGNLYIKNSIVDGDILFQGDDGSGTAVTNYFTINGGGGETRFQKNTRHNDGVKAQFGNSDDLQIYHDSSDNNSYIKELGSGSLQIWAKDFEVYNADGTETLINADVNAGVQLYFDNSTKIATTSTGIAVTGNADISGQVTVGTSNSIFAEDVLRFNSTGTAFIDHTTVGATINFRVSNSAVLDTTALIIQGSGNSTFGTQAFATTATSTGDPSSTLTTKGYVDSLITGATIYRGTWDPDASLNSGYGNPNLNTVTQTSGYYYICSADGAATPNGTATEPNTWNTGDWVIWNDDIGASGEWQKIDNSSVLSGVGTGQTVALWEGASSVTDSETLGNAPITVSGNNAIFAGDVTSTGLTVDYTGNRTGDAGILVTNDGSDWGIKVDKDGTTDYGILSQTDGENAIVVRNAAGVDKIQLQGDGDASFAGDVTVGTGVIKTSIGGDIAITQGAIGLRINDSASAISPTTASANNDNTVDLGVSNIRWKDLYLGGDINLAAGKKLQYSANSFMTPENNVSGAEISTAGTFIVKTGTTPTLGLTLDASQNATFAGKILVGTGATAAASINSYSTTVSTGLYSALRVIEHGTASSYWDIGATNASNTLLNFYHNGNTTPKIFFTHTGGATFAGIVQAASYKIGGVTVLQGTSTVTVGSGGGTGKVQLNTTSGVGLILDGSNVGVGTTTPQEKLHIEGTGAASEMQILVSGASDTVGHTAGIGLRAEGGESNSNVRIKGGIFFERIAGSFGNGKMILAVNSSVSNTSVTVADHALTIDTNKNVGIGRSTSITAKLFVEGPADTSTISTSSTPAARINNGGAISNWIGSNGYNYGYIQSIQDDGSNNLKPLSLQPLGGNVGIGTTSPDVRLEVVEASPTDGIVADFVNSTNAGGTIAAIKLSNADSEACDVVLGANRVGANFGSDFFISTSDGVDGTNRERFRITEAGSVGIGTTSPGTINSVAFSGVGLHVKFGTLGRTITEGSSEASYLLNNSGASANQRIKYIQSTAGNLAIGSFNDNGLARPQITVLNSGNVGIGTTGPTANLHISDTADAVLKIEGDTINSDETKGAKILLITDNGYRTAAITGGNATYETSSGNFNALNLQSKDIRFHTGVAQDYDLAVERMRITGTGALSFGTTGTAYGTSGQVLTSAGNASPTWTTPTTGTVTGGGSNTYLAKWTTANNINSSAMFQAASGNFSIGITTPNAKLSVVNDISIGTSATDVLRLSNISGVGGIYGFGSRNLAFGSITNGEVMRVDNINERVGIGTTGPQSKLQVAGGIQMANDTATASAAKVGTMRYRTATNEPVAVTGIDFITNGDFATDTDWTKSSNVSISGGQATFTANSAAQYIIQGSLWPANSLSGQKVQLTYTVISNSLNAGDFRIGGYTGASAFTLTGLPTTVGTHSVTLDVRTSVGDDNAIDLYVTNAATSGVFVIDNVALIEVTEEDASYADMCMQTGSSTYEWVNIVRNTY